MANRDTHFETLLAQCRGPMTYTTPMVRRLREVPPGKTMTRRVITNLTQNRRGGWSWKRHAGKRTYYGTFGSRATEALREFLLNHARFAPGDLAYIAEGIEAGPDPTDNDLDCAYYSVDDCTPVHQEGGELVYWRWKPCGLPSRFMPKRFARLILRIDEVRAERVQEISETDAAAEGFPFGCDAIDWFRDLWDSIHSRTTHDWKSNPWCFVYAFHVEARRPERSDA